jgi:TonB family protein
MEFGGAACGNSRVRGKANAEAGLRATTPIKTGAWKVSVSGVSGSARPPIGGRHGRGWIFLLVSAAILIAVLWWHWNLGWEDLESGLPKNEKTSEVPQPQAHVPADVMEKLVTHRVDPDYPGVARSANLQAVIVLDVVVGRDGSVVDMHAQNGPEVLAQAAMDALRWWRFEPYRVNGQPVVVETTVAVEFKP